MKVFGTGYWRRAVFYDEIDDFRSYVSRNDGGDEFRCRTASYILIYRPATPDEYRELLLPTASVLVTGIVSNDDLLKDIRQILGLEGDGEAEDDGR